MLPDKVWCISYPRSGSTWLRILLANVFYPEQGWAQETIGKFSRSQNQLKKLDPDIFPVVVKTHGTTNKGIENGIYIYRDPRDVALSYYYYKAYHKRGEKFEAYLKRFVDGDIPHIRWADHVKYWLVTNPQKAIIYSVKYEDMLDAPVGVLRGITEFMGFAIPDEVLENAVDASRYEKIVTDAYDRNRFGLRGTSGGWKERFSDRWNKVFWNQFGEMMEKLGYER